MRPRYAATEEKFLAGKEREKRGGRGLFAVAAAGPFRLEELLDQAVDVDVVLCPPVELVFQQLLFAVVVLAQQELVEGDWFEAGFFQLSLNHNLLPHVGGCLDEAVQELHARHL